MHNEPFERSWYSFQSVNKQIKSLVHDQMYATMTFDSLIFRYCTTVSDRFFIPWFLSVMAAVAVRKKVVNIGHFSPSFYIQSLQSFYLLDQINKKCVYWLHCKSEKNRTEPNELDELKYSKSLNQITSDTHWHAFLYLHAYIYTLYYPI